MKSNKKPRHPASEAVLELRKALGKTQQQFANEILPIAISSIARWETGDPPKGDALKRLGEIARQHGLFALESEFVDLHLNSLKEGVPDLTMVPRTETKKEHGHLFVRVEGSDELTFAQYFIQLRGAFDSDNPEIRKAAEAALASVRVAARIAMGNPKVEKSTGAFTAAVAHGIPQPKPKTIRRRK